MSKRTEDELPFRIRPNRPRRSGSGEERAWSNALTTVLRYARSSRQGRRSDQGTVSRYAGRQRCAVRVMYSPNTTARQWRAHGRYIARESATGDHRRTGFDANGADVDPAATLDRWQSAGDPRLWKLIVAPEFGERLDLERLTRDLVTRIESDLGTRLQWVAVVHLNTEHPHVHIALRGVRDDGRPLELRRDYIRSGIRALAEELCTNQLGFRSELDRVASERGEITARRYTSLDRLIARSASDAGDPARIQFRLDARTGSRREQHLAVRLAVLRAMGLADSVAPGTWLIRRDFELVLRAMQKASDRQKMLSAHGAALSDTRLQVSVLDWRTTNVAEGRVLIHGEDETGTASGRHYLVLEGTDARAHMIYYTTDLERARAEGKLHPGAFVRVRKQFADRKPNLHVEDLGSADAILTNRLHLESTARGLIRRGIVPTEDGWGGWLGRYQAALAEAAHQVSQRSLNRRRDSSLER
jgi:type IV secretory pathway VirD2 relaxase